MTLTLPSHVTHGDQKGNNRVDQQQKKPRRCRHKNIASHVPNEEPVHLVGLGAMPARFNTLSEEWPLRRRLAKLFVALSVKRLPPSDRVSTEVFMRRDCAKSATPLSPIELLLNHERRDKGGGERDQT